MKFKPTDCFNVSEEVLAQEVGGETVLLDLNGENYFGLNEVGTRIWQLLQSGATVNEVLDTLSDEYDASREQLELDLNDLLARLLGLELVSQA